MTTTYESQCISRKELTSGMRQTIFEFNYENINLRKFGEFESIIEYFQVSAHDHEFKTMWKITRKLNAAYIHHVEIDDVEVYTSGSWINLELIEYNIHFNSIIIIESMENFTNFVYNSFDEPVLNRNLTNVYSKTNEKKILMKMIITRPSTSEIKIVNDYSFINFDNEEIPLIFNVDDKQIFTNKNIILSRCKVFAWMFHCNWEENQSNIIVIPNCNIEIFTYVLNFLYNGKLNIFENMKLLNIIKIAQLYQIMDLVNVCVYRISSNLTIKNIEKIFLHSDQYQLTDLKKDCMKFINRNKKEIIFSDKFKILSIKFPYLLLELFQSEIIE